MLIYSTARKASWRFVPLTLALPLLGKLNVPKTNIFRHAKCASRLLVDFVEQADGNDERVTMGRSILLVAVVSDPNAVFENSVRFSLLILMKNSPFEIHFPEDPSFYS